MSVSGVCPACKTAYDRPDDIIEWNCPCGWVEGLEVAPVAVPVVAPIVPAASPAPDMPAA